MSDLVKRLDEQRQAALKQAREIAERAVAGKEIAEDEAAYVKANSEFDRLTGLMRDEQKHESEERATAEAFETAAKAAKHSPTKVTPERDESAWLVECRKAIVGKSATRGGAEQRLPLVDEITTRNAYGMPELRLLGFNLTDAGKGPETVPVTLAESLFRKLFDDSTILRAGVRIFNTTGGEKMKFPRLVSRGPLSQVAARVAEQGQIQKSTAAFDQVEFEAYKYGQITQADREVIQDSVIGIQALMGEVLGANMAEYLAYDLTLGTGVGMPKGVLALIPAGNLVTSATGKVGAIESSDQLLDIVWKLKPTYRRNGKFMMNDTAVLGIRKFKINGEANNYAFTAGLGGAPDNLLGYPLLTDPNLAVPALSAKSIVFADFSKYYVRMVSDIRVEWSTEYAWDTDLVSVKAVLRADGDAIDDTAFAGFVGAAT